MKYQSVLTSQEEIDKVYEEGKLTAILITGDDCAPCAQMKKNLVEAGFDGKVHNLNASQYKELAVNNFSIRSVPVFVMMRKEPGATVATMAGALVGAKTPSEITERYNAVS